MVTFINFGELSFFREETRNGIGDRLDTEKQTAIFHFKIVEIVL